MCTPKLPSNNWENDHQQLRCAFFNALNIIYIYILYMEFNKDKCKDKYINITYIYMLPPHVPISHLGNEACEHREGRLASSASP